MKISGTLTVATLAVSLIATGATAAVAKPKPDAKERELERRTVAALKYFCNTPHHDDTFYAEYLDVARMSTWNFKDGASPYDEALAEVAQDSGSGSEDFLGTQPAGMTDTMRTRICTDKRDDLLEAVDRITQEKKSGLKDEYQNNDAAIKELPFKKLDTLEKAIEAEKARLA